MARKRRQRGLGYWGYPNPRELRRDALALANASLPSAQSINRQYGRALGDVRGFTDALVDLLEGSSGRAAGAYDESIRQQRGVNEAAAARLAELGPEYAGAGVATGAAGDSALSRLLGGRASAARFGAAQPGIAGARGALGVTGLVNARTEAHRERNEALRGQFMQALEQLRSQALAEAAFNRESFEGDRSFREARRQFNVQTAQRERELAAAQSGTGSEDAREARGQRIDLKRDMFDTARELHEGKTVKVPGGFGKPETSKTTRPPYAKAFNRLWATYASELRYWGLKNPQIRKMIKNALRQAGYKPPRPQGTGTPGPKSAPGPSEF